MKNPPLIHVIDDDASLLAATIELLNAAGYRARGYASTGEFLLEPPADEPGCLLLDVRLPGPSGLDLQAAMGRHGIALPVIFLTGAVEFLEKPVARDTLLEAIRRALDNDAQQRAAGEDARRRSARLRLLTAREREVFERIVQGKLNKQIADELGVALRTVKAYRAQLMTKLGVNSAAELGRLAGLEGPPPAD
jgi:FixJ family two-component response regulator